MTGYDAAAFAAGALGAAAVARTGGGTVRWAVAASAALVAGVAGAFDALLQLGREGREPGALERRRLLACGGAGGFAVAALLAGPAAGALVALAAPAAVGRVLRARRRAYRRAVARGAPAIATALADSLAAGHALRRAVAESAASVGGAAGAELRRVAAALEAGQPTAAALDDLRARCPAPSIDAIATAALVQRRAGGDLSGLLRRLAHAFEDELRLAGEVHAATAQARFTGALVVGLPLGGAVLAELAAPGFAAGIARSPLTAALVVAALALQAAAGLLIRRLGSARA